MTKVKAQLVPLLRVSTLLSIRNVCIKLMWYLLKEGLNANALKLTLICHHKVQRSSSSSSCLQTLILGGWSPAAVARVWLFRSSCQSKWSCCLVLADLSFSSSGPAEPNEWSTGFCGKDSMWGVFFPHTFLQCTNKQHSHHCTLSLLQCKWRFPLRCYFGFYFWITSYCGGCS